MGRSALDGQQHQQFCLLLMQHYLYEISSLNCCPIGHQDISLCEMSCVMVPILVDTNPCSWEKRKYGEVSGSGHAAYTLSIRTRIFPESNFFRGMEYPISGHVVETRRVKTCKRPYFSRFAKNHGVPLTNAIIFAFHFH